MPVDLIDESRPGAQAYTFSMINPTGPEARPPPWAKLLAPVAKCLDRKPKKQSTNVLAAAPPAPKSYFETSILESFLARFPWLVSLMLIQVTWCGVS